MSCFTAHSCRCQRNRPQRGQSYSGGGSGTLLWQGLQLQLGSLGPDGVTLITELETCADCTVRERAWWMGGLEGHPKASGSHLIMKQLGIHKLKYEISNMSERALLLSRVFRRASSVPLKVDFAQRCLVIKVSLEPAVADDSIGRSLWQRLQSLMRPDVPSAPGSTTSSDWQLVFPFRHLRRGMLLSDLDHSLSFTVRQPPKVLQEAEDNFVAELLAGREPEPKLLCGKQLELKTEGAAAGEAACLGSHLLGHCLTYKLELPDEVWRGMLLPGRSCRQDTQR